MRVAAEDFGSKCIRLCNESVVGVVLIDNVVVEDGVPKGDSPSKSERVKTLSI